MKVVKEADAGKHDRTYAHDEIKRQAMYQPGSIRTLKKLSEAQHSMRQALDVDLEPDSASPTSSSDVSSTQEELKFPGNAEGSED